MSECGLVVVKPLTSLDKPEGFISPAFDIPGGASPPAPPNKLEGHVYAGKFDSFIV